MKILVLIEIMSFNHEKNRFENFVWNNHRIPKFKTDEDPIGELETTQIKEYWKRHPGQHT